MGEANFYYFTCLKICFSGICRLYQVEYYILQLAG